jgi:ribosomal protein S18 acetylase RimI-like enzyme
MIKIREATSADIPLIQELAHRIWPQTYIPVIGASQVNYMLDRFYSTAMLGSQIAETGHQFIIAETNDQPVAFAAWSGVEPGTCKLHKLYILPQQQGKGVGRMLLNHIRQILANAGISRLILNVNRYNNVAIAFYKALGFNIFKEEDIAIGNDFFMNDFVMELLV